jgi:hypothetical protein
MARVRIITSEVLKTFLADIETDIAALIIQIPSGIFDKNRCHIIGTIVKNYYRLKEFTNSDSDADSDIDQEDIGSSESSGEVLSVAVIDQDFDMSDTADVDDKDVIDAINEMTSMANVSGIGDEVYDVNISDSPTMMDYDNATLDTLDTVDSSGDEYPTTDTDYSEQAAMKACIELMNNNTSSMMDNGIGKGKGKGNGTTIPTETRFRIDPFIWEDADIPSLPTTPKPIYDAIPLSVPTLVLPVVVPPIIPVDEDDNCTDHVQHSEMPDYNPELPMLAVFITGMGPISADILKTGL